MQSQLFKLLLPSLALLVLGMSSLSSIGQQKYESERRIKRDQVPAKALSFIDSLNLESKVRWNFEEALESSSVEAKYKHKGEKYSVEFDTLGNLQDIEIDIPWRDAEEQLKESINNQLNQDCRKYKVQNAQIQYSGERSVLLEKLRSGSTKSTFTTRFELIVRCASDSDVNLFEYLFSDAGERLSTFKIIFKNSNHLEY